MAKHMIGVTVACDCRHAAASVKRAGGLPSVAVGYMLPFGLCGDN